MQIVLGRAIYPCVGFLLGILMLAGCKISDTHTSTRMHLANGSDTPVVFLAIEDSETGASVAPNRLASPLPPKAVYSAILSRPGNYWILTETAAAGSVIRRIEGPIRVERGVHNWMFTREDVVPLYQNSVEESGLALARAPR